MIDGIDLPGKPGERKRPITTFMDWAMRVNMFENNYLSQGNGWDHDAKRSVNAVNAEQEGKFPYSEWKKMSKQQILGHINTKIEKIGEEFILFDVKLIKKAQKAALLDLFIEHSTAEYHHIDVWEKGRRWRYQAVGYYGVSEEKLVTVTDEEILAMITMVRTRNSCSESEWEAVLEARKKELSAKPLMIGMLLERDHDEKWLHTFTALIGIVDGDELHYYDFPRLQKNRNDQKRDLDHTRICRKKWRNTGKTFGTFDELIKDYPEYECKKEELERLLLIRNNVRDQRARKYIR